MAPRIGVILLDHGEPSEYNQYTYYPFRNFAQSLITMGMIPAAENGANGERYILGSDTVTSTAELVEIAHSIYPDIKKQRFKPSRGMLKFMAFMIEMGAKLTGREPTILRKQVDLYYDKSPF